MKVALAVTLLTSVSLVFGQSLKQQLALLKAQVSVVHGLLAKECPGEKTRRQVGDESTRIAVQRTLYEQLLKQLDECRKKNPCNYAISLTESWRSDHKASNIKPGGRHSFTGYACQLSSDDSQWFRFKGAAGNRLLNTCVKENSCGTQIPLWTNEKMPVAIGVSTRVKVYGSYKDNCKYFNYFVNVIKCSSAPNDYIYQQTTNMKLDAVNRCSASFCGMN